MSLPVNRLLMWASPLQQASHSRAWAQVHAVRLVPKSSVMRYMIGPGLVAEVPIVDVNLGMCKPHAWH